MRSKVDIQFPAVSYLKISVSWARHLVVTCSRFIAVIYFINPLHAPAVSFLSLFFDPEDGSDIFLLNVGWFSTVYTARSFIPQVRTLHSHCFENLEPYTFVHVVLETLIWYP
jgi:hypothetical protein